jgi:hypothetical protein
VTSPRIEEEVLCPTCGEPAIYREHPKADRRPAGWYCPNVLCTSTGLVSQALAQVEADDAAS